MAGVFAAMANSDPLAPRGQSDMQRQLNRRFCDNPECKKEYWHSGRYCSKECKITHDKKP